MFWYKMIHQKESLEDLKSLFPVRQILAVTINHIHQTSIIENSFWLCSLSINLSSTLERETEGERERERKRERDKEREKEKDRDR